MGKVKLSQAVSYALDEMNYGSAEYARAYRFAIRALDELRLDITGQSATCTLPVNCDLTVNLPDNFIRETKVGIWGANNNIVGLTRSNDLSFETTIQDYEYTDPNENYYKLNDERFNTYVTESLGKGSYANVGYFRIDYEARIIVLNPEFTYSEIVVEYLKKEEIDGEYCVDERLLESVAAYIRYKWHIGKKGTSVGERREYERLWHKEKRNAKYRIKKPLIQDMNRSAREGTKGGLKS
jgi:hypothetical protein